MSRHIDKSSQTYVQCDQIVQLFLFYKSSPKFCQVFGLFKNANHYIKAAVATFWVTFGKKLGLLFVPTSGHTVCGLPAKKVMMSLKDFLEIKFGRELKG